MRLKKVSVKNLFGYYCYDINFNQKRSITIIHAPNGYGKTTVLKLVKGILELDFKSIYQVPLDEILIEFENDISIVVSKYNSINENNKRWDNPIEIEYSVKKLEDTLFDFRHKFNINSIRVIEENGLKEYFERAEMQRRRRIVEEEDRESGNIYKKYSKLESIIESVGLCATKINFIDSNRLFVSEKAQLDESNFAMRSEDNWRRNTLRQESEIYSHSLVESINIYAEELQTLISDARRKFANLSESRERDFPNRLVEYVYGNEVPLCEVDIINKLAGIERSRDELEKLGLVLKGKTTMLPANRNLDETMLKFYSLYIADTELKLQAFDDIKPKLKLLQNIINNKTKFSNKMMEFNTIRGLTFRPIETNVNRRTDIPLEKLSSGEKHNFILFYELIFKCDKNCIVLIDEPEISLHVAWQMQFVSEISRICEMNGMQAIIATHSPDIVNGNDDLLVSLGEV